MADLDIADLEAIVAALRPADRAAALPSTASGSSATASSSAAKSNPAAFSPAEDGGIVLCAAAVCVRLPIPAGYAGR